MPRCDFVCCESARSGGAMQLLRARRAAACEVLLFTMSNWRVNKLNIPEL
jgi:hypothetical protein